MKYRTPMEDLAPMRGILLSLAAGTGLWLLGFILFWLAWAC